MRCKKCNQLIIDEYITAVGATWHPACFECAKCKLPIMGNFNKKDGKPYHTECYMDLFLPKCSVCQKILVGTYAVDYWKNKFCLEHLDDKKYHKCYSCSRIICEDLTQGGVRYYDNRTVCNICRRTAVDDTATIQKITARVREKMRGWGLPLSNQDFPIKLANEYEITQGKIYAGKPPCGLTKSATYIRAGKITAKTVEAIMILYGLPREFVASIMAHELCHVLIIEKKFPDLEPFVEEGLCELSEYLWLSERDTPMAKFRQWATENNPDPIYGDGFRAAQKAQGKANFVTLLKYVKTNGCFPSSPLS